MSLDEKKDEQEFIEMMVRIAKWHWQHRDVTIAVGPSSMGSMYGPRIEVRRGEKYRCWHPDVVGHTYEFHLDRALDKLEHSDESGLLE